MISLIRRSGEVVLHTLHKRVTIQYPDAETPDQAAVAGPDHPVP